MKAIAKGPNEKSINCIAVAGLFVNRWSLLRALSNMPGVKIKDKAIIKNFIKDKPAITFEYQGAEFLVEAEYFAGNELEIRHIQARPVQELLEIKEYLLCS
jgi:hypothetical protein